MSWQDELWGAAKRAMDEGGIVIFEVYPEKQHERRFVVKYRPLDKISSGKETWIVDD